MSNLFKAPEDTVIAGADVVDPDDPTSSAPPEKTKWERLWPVFACGAGLYSDGYLNGVCFVFSGGGGCSVLWRMVWW